MEITDHRYVSLTSYKRDGTGVPVAVWIAPLPDGRAGFTTDGSSWKAKRIRNNPSVTLRPCDLRGNVPGDAVEVAATAAVVTEGDDYDAVCRAVGKKYGVLYWVVDLGSRIKALFGRDDHRAAIVITLT